MAATAELTIGGSNYTNDGFADKGVIQFDSDATVMVPTTLSFIRGGSFTRIGSGGASGTLSIDATLNTGLGFETSGGFVKVDAQSTSSDQWWFFFWGI